jgi:hypothetical protein
VNDEPVATLAGAVLLIERFARPAATEREAPVVWTDWFVVEGGFVALVAGDPVTV